jgi:Flp pilus assembly pilin Flp
VNAQVKSRRNAVADFHRDEDGLEAIQVVMIVAIAAIILIFVKTVIWPKISDWVNQQIQNLIG